NRLGLPRCPFFGGGIAPARDVAEELSRLPAGALRSPRRAMLAYGEPPPTPSCCSVLQHVPNGFTLPPTCAKTREPCIPKRLAGLQRAYLTQSDPCPRRHLYVLRLSLATT